MSDRLRPLAFPAAFFLALLALLLTWTIATPLFASPDEPAHLYKSYGTAHGELLGTPIADQPSNVRLFDVPDSMGQGNVMCYFFVPDQPADCATGSSSAGVSAAAVYPPFWYALVGGGARLIDPTSQRAYRAVAAGLCAALMAAAFAVARRSTAGHLTPLLLLGLTPMTLFLAATVNPNGFEIAAFLLIWTLCLHLEPVGERNRAASWQGGVAVGALVATVLLSRFASIIWVVVGVAVVAILLGRPGLQRFLNPRFLVPSVGATFAAVAALAAWSRYSGAEAEDSRIASDFTRSHVVSYTVRQLPEFATQMIGVLGWLDTRMPRVTYLAFAAMLVVALAGVAISRNRRLQFATVTVFAALATVPVAVNVISAAKAGLIWQGRYALPLYVGLGVLGMIGWRDAIERTRFRPVRSIRLGLCAAFVIGEIAGFWQTVRRFTVGADGKIWLTDPLPWRPPVAPMALIAANAVLVVVFVAVLLLGTHHRAPVAGFAELHDGPNGSVVVGQRPPARVDG